MINFIKSFFTTVIDLENLDKQPASRGFGPLVVKTFYIEVPPGKKTIQETFDLMKKNINKFKPVYIGKIRALENTKIKKGNRLILKLVGPYNGPVEVDDVTDKSFRFMTLDNHPEAGFIEFSIIEGERNYFKIHSEVRANELFFYVSYHYFKFASLVQDRISIGFMKKFYYIATGEKAHTSQVCKEKHVYPVKKSLGKPVNLKMTSVKS